MVYKTTTTMATKNLSNLNLSLNLSKLYDDVVIPISKESIKLTDKQKKRLRAIRFKNDIKNKFQSKFVFDDQKQRALFHHPLLSTNPLQAKYDQTTFPNQKNFGKMIADSFANDLKILTMMAIAPTQSGKTGSMLATAYECLCNPILNMPPENIFIFTSHSSREWLDQTRSRFPAQFANQIFHRNMFNKFIDQVKDKSNVLIIFDESHIANKFNQTLFKVYNSLNLYDINYLYEKNIKTLHFTATPEVLVENLTSTWKHSCKVVKMDVPDSYVSIERLNKDGRIKEYKDLCGYNPLTKQVMPEVYNNIEEIREYLGNKPKIHIIRTPRGMGHNIVIQNFRKVFGENYEYISEPMIKDFDTFTDKVVKKHTFLFIKDKLRCAKTINHANVGVLYERWVIKPNSSSILQGLAGRLTGYHNNYNSVVFTHNYSLFNSTYKYNSFFIPF